jgi:hypothetical protein
MSLAVPPPRTPPGFFADAAAMTTLTIASSDIPDATLRQ